MKPTTFLCTGLLVMMCGFVTQAGDLANTITNATGIFGLGPLDASSGTVREISEKFRQPELARLQQLVNSPEFQAPLRKYSCGEPVPKLTFTVDIRPRGLAQTRAVDIAYSPGFPPTGRTRGLCFGVDYLLDKAVASLDPDPQEETTREPHCDCSKRDSNEEWVTFPGPDEILAPAKVAARNAAESADEAQENKAENLSTIHLDPADGEAGPGNAGGQLVTREVLMGKLPAEEKVSMLAVDPTFSHWACVVTRGGKQLVVRDGVEGKEYDEIPRDQKLTFSADGRHLAYVARRGDKMLVVADGKEGKAYEDVETLFHPIYSPDSRHLAYIATKPVFGLPPEKSFVVLDGKELKGYELVEAIQFSPDGKHLAYNADPHWNRGSVVVVDEKKGKAYDQVVDKVFSPDGNHLAYEAFNRTNRSPESAGLEFVVMDGTEGKHYQTVSSIRLSPDGKHLAYVAQTGATGLLKALVEDGAERKYANVDGPTFSPDSRHLAAAARFATNWLVLIDGKKLEPQPSLAAGYVDFCPDMDLAFSPDSRHLAYVGRGPGTNWLVVLDGIAVNSYERIAVPPVFSPDSRRLAYVIERGGKCIPVLGGREGNAYDQILTWHPISDYGVRTVGLNFDSRGVVHALAKRGNEILRLEIELARK